MILCRLASRPEGATRVVVLIGQLRRADQARASLAIIHMVNAVAEAKTVVASADAGWARNNVHDSAHAVLAAISWRIVVEIGYLSLSELATPSP